MDYTRVTRNAIYRISIKYGSSRLADKPLVACGRLQQSLLSAEKIWSRSLWRMNQLLERQEKQGAEPDCASQLLNFQQEVQDLPDLSEHVLVEFVQAVEQLLLHHQASGVCEVLATFGLDESSLKGQNSLRAGVIASIIHRSEASLNTLLPRLRHIITVSSGMLWTDYIHYYVIYLGQQHQAKEMSGPQTAEALRQMLDQLHPEELRAVLNRPDISGRLALHHAAEYGLAEACNELLGRAKNVHVALPAKQLFRTTQNMYRDSPLHMAVAKGYTRVVTVLLAYLEVEQLSHDETAVQMCESLLLLSIRSKYPETASLLRAMESIFSQEDLKQNQMLYLASLYGNADAVDALLAAGVPAYTRHASLDQTPLIVASVRGHLAVVDLLLQTKCDWGARDLRGWRAVEHAAFRGFPAVVRALQAKKQEGDDYEPDAGVLSDAVAPRIMRTVKRMEKPPRTVASNYSQIFVNLGSSDLEKPAAESVDIESYLRAIMPCVMPKSSLTLKISCPGFAIESYVVQLPVVEDRVNDPWCFETTQPDSATLMFELFTSISEDGLGEPQPVAVAVALLGDLRKTLERGNESLIRSHTIPFIWHSKNNKGPMSAGTLTFTFLVARPFHQRSHGAVLPNPPDPLTHRGGATIVGGHRGLGQNIKADMQLQMGENTLESFEQARRLGAAVLEMDVQVTKDDVPVIYHDFLVSEAGADIPMHELSLDQFMVLSDVQSPLSKTKSGMVASRPRALSTGSAEPCDRSCTGFNDRMRTTFDYGSSGFKPNIRGQCIHGPFITLVDVLTKIERHVCLDIEIKYPMLYESRYWSMNTFAMEINRFLDDILDVVYQHGRSRPIYFSSFSPEVCIVLAAKQTIYPILFLNDSSNWDTFDTRAVSVQSAMHFARAFELPGIVMASEPLIDAPGLISFMQEQGFYVASYGSLNDDGENARVSQSTKGYGLLDSYG